MNIAEILPEEDYSLKMRFERRTPASFFRPGKDHEEVVSERRHWLTHDSETCLALAPEGAPLLDETIEIAVATETLPGENNEWTGRDLDPLEKCKLLGENWEADFLLMNPDADGVFRMVGGCLCFPSHWDLAEKMGQPMGAIHKPVPGLNDTLGKQIDGFLRKMKPGISWERNNWGLSRSPDRNQHPARGLPRLDDTVSLIDVWWRLEEQSLVALPKSGGILFGIKIVIRPLSEIAENPSARRGMIRALETMPEAMAEYKGISSARNRLLELLL